MDNKNVISSNSVNQLNISYLILSNLNEKSSSKN